MGKPTSTPDPFRLPSVFDREDRDIHFLPFKPLERGAFKFPLEPPRCVLCEMGVPTRNGEKARD